MDVQERLTLEAVSAETLIASEHLHRYEFAARFCRGLRVLDLCCGSGYGSRIVAAEAETVLGVDNDQATVDAARASITEPNVAFEAADAESFLAHTPEDRFDAIVCFEGLEHLPRVDQVLDKLRGRASAGVRIIASVPNSKTFEEENAFHRTEFDHEAAVSAFAGFDDVVIVEQFLAEGSLILAADSPEGGIRATLLATDRAESAYANHFIACVGVRDALQTLLPSARATLRLAPSYNRYMRNLEAANRDLRRVNAQLGREHLGKDGSAAASHVVRLEGALAEVERLREAARERDELRGQVHAMSAIIEDMASSTSWRLTAPLRASKRVTDGSR